MAITIVDTPTANNVVPLFNPFYYVVDSDNNTKLNFKYIFDLEYTPEGGGSISIGRFKVYPNPTDNYGYFDPHSIFKNYVNNNQFNPFLQNLGTVNNSYIYCSLSIGEEYDDSATPPYTGTTIYPGLEIEGIYGLNSIFQFNEPVDLNNWDCVDVSGKFLLTKWESGFNKKIPRNSWETIAGFTSNKNTGIFYVRYFTYNSGGTLNGTFELTNSLDTLKVEIPVGPKNLSLITATNISGGGTRAIVNSTVYSYYIQIDDGTNLTSTNYYYTIDDNCYRYDIKRLAWLNNLGSYEYYSFPLKSIEGVKINSGNWNKKIGYGYQIGDRGKITNFINNDKLLILTTDWLRDYEARYIETIFTSPSIYLIDDGLYTKTPLILKTTDSELKREGNDILINYTLEFEYAHKLYGQNG